METESTDQAHYMTDSWQENINQFSKEDWKTCPSCMEDWSSLRPCQYLNDNHRSVVTSVCVRCAETLVSFEKIASRSPLDGVHVELKWSGPRRMNVAIGDKMDSVERPSNAYAVVSYGLSRYIATSSGTGTPLQFKEEGAQDPQYANNVFSLWSTIKNQLLNPKKDEIDHQVNQVREARSRHQYA